MRRDTVSGAGLRSMLRSARVAAGASIAASCPEADEIDFLGQIPREKAVRCRGRARGTEQEFLPHAARLAGAIRASANLAPAWLRKAMRGDLARRHMEGWSRTIESRLPALWAWDGVARRGYSVHRLLRAVDHVRRTCWVRWQVAITPVEALEATARHGDRQAVFSAVLIAAGENPVVIQRKSWNWADLAAAIRIARMPRRHRQAARYALAT